MSATQSGIWRLYGLDIAAPVPLSDTPATSARADLTISFGPPAPVGDAALPGRLLGEARAEGRLLEAAFERDGVVSLLFPRILVAHLDLARAAVDVRADPAADPALVQRLVVSALPASWMMLTGRPVLHASAVQVGDGAAVFVGSSGSGKSTIAAALAGAGAGWITDDVCRLEETEAGGWVCHPDAGRVRLRSASAALASLFPGAAVAPADGRTTVVLDTPASPVAVGAVVLPRLSRDVSQLEATRLRGARSVVGLFEHPRMVSLGEACSRSLFEFGASLVAAVPTWELVVPWRPVTPDLAVELLDVVSGLLDSGTERDR